MDIVLSGSPTTDSIQTPTITSSGPVQLVTGQLLRATVQSVTNSLVRLNVDGKMLMAHSKVPLQAQQKVLLEVTQATPNQVTMQVLKPAAGGEATPRTAPPAIPSDLQALLSGWGVEVDEINEAIAKGLFRHGQSVNPEDVQTVRALWRAIPGHQTGQLDTVAYLHAKQLPVSKETLALAHTLLNESPKISQQLTDLRLTMSEAHGQLQTLAGKPVFPARLATALQTALAQMSTWSIAADTPPPELVARLANIVKSLGTPPEAEIARSGLEPGAPPVKGEGQPAPPNQGRPITPAVTAESQPAMPALKGEGQPRGPTTPTEVNTPAPTGKQITTPAAQIVNEIAQPAGRSPGEAATNQANPLHRLAAVISEALANPELDEATVQTLNRLSTQLESTAKALGALHLSNAGNPINPTGDQVYLFPIPLTLPNGEQTAHLKVYRQPGRQTIDPDNMRLALLLDLPELGEIAINLSLQKSEGQLSGKILSGLEQTHQLVTEALNELHDSLSELGYRVNALTSDLLPAETITEFGSDDEAEAMTISLSQINVRA